MRKLHLVGLTTDRDGLIFTARKGSKSGGFIVPLDDKVLAAVAEARDAGNGAPSEVEVVTGELEPVARRLRSQSVLTPREMQSRLRAGRSIEEVAAEAGVDTEWVARFAVPILAEQAQVVELARGLVYAKPRLGESSQRLGASVVQNLSDRGVFMPDDVVNAGWSAFQLHDSVWMVRFRYRSRGREQEAQWEIDVSTGRLHARNRHASDLGYVEPGRRSRVRDAEEDTDDDTTAAAAAPKRRTRPRPPVPSVPRSRRTPAVPTRPKSKARASKATKATKATKASRASKVSKVSKATRASYVGKTAKASKSANASKVVKAAGKTPSPKRVPTTAKNRSKAAPPKSTGGRRSSKGPPTPEAGPAAGSGSVRMAVAQVSTARVAATLASADREPWAAAVRPRQGARRAGTAEPARQRHDIADATEAVPSFQPRPLPAGGDRSPPDRVRKVTVRKPSPANAGPDPVSLPAARRPAPRTEPFPAERPKRRRLRAR